MINALKSGTKCMEKFKEIFLSILALVLLYCFWAYGVPYFFNSSIGEGFMVHIFIPLFLGGFGIFFFGLIYTFFLKPIDKFQNTPYYLPLMIIVAWLFGYMFLKFMGSY